MCERHFGSDMLNILRWWRICVTETFVAFPFGFSIFDRCVIGTISNTHILLISLFYHGLTDNIPSLFKSRTRTAVSSFRSMDLIRCSRVFDIMEVLYSQLLLVFRELYLCEKNENSTDNELLPTFYISGKNENSQSKNGLNTLLSLFRPNWFEVVHADCLNVDLDLK